jgi:tellurite resistance protein
MLTNSLRSFRWYTSILTTIFVFAATATSAFAQTTEVSDSSKSIREGINRVWQILFLGESGTGSGSIFQVVNSFMLFFAFAIMSYRGILLYRESQQESGEGFTQALIVDKVVPAAIVFLLIASNGFNGGILVLSARNAVYNLDKQVALKVEVIAKTSELAGDFQGEKEALERLREKQADCAALDPERDGATNPDVAQCIEELKRQIDNEVATGAIKSGATIRKLKEAQENAGNPLRALGSSIVSAVGDAGNKVINGIIKYWLLLFGVLYTLIVEGAMLIMGLIAPIAICTSLLNLKPLIEWLTKFAGLGIMKITYTLSVAAFQILNSAAGKETGESFFALALGFGAPFLSILAASQTGGIVGAAVEGSVLLAAGKASRFAGGKIGGAAGKAAKVGGKIGGAAFNKLAPAPIKTAVKAVSSFAAKVRK